MGYWDPVPSRAPCHGSDAAPATAAGPGGPPGPPTSQRRRPAAAGGPWCHGPPVPPRPAPAYLQFRRPPSLTAPARTPSESRSAPRHGPGGDLKLSPPESGHVERRPGPGHLSEAVRPGTAGAMATAVTVPGRRSAVRQLRPGGPGPTMKEIIEMSVREMRQELDSMGISYGDCIEKGDFVSKLNAARQSTKLMSGTE